MNAFKSRSFLLLALSFGLLLPTQAEFVELDISSYYNYDGVATSDEITANVPGNGNFLKDSLGDHNMGNSRGFANQASVGANTGLPDSGVVTGAGGRTYGISSNFDNGTDYLTAADNMIHLRADNSTASDSITLTLSGADQQQYSDFNLAYVTRIDATASNYRSYITATYTDASSAIVVDTGLSGGVTGGSFGLTNLNQTSSAYTFTNQAPGTGETIGITPAHSMTYSLAQSGPSNSIRNTAATLWEFDSAIALDSSKTLESLTITVNRGGGSTSNRSQDLFVLGVTATAIPEPSSLILLVCALGGFLLLRRK